MADKIPYVVSSLDGIENADAYEQAGDSYVLRRDALPIDLPEGWGIENTQGLHNTVRQTRQERDDFKKKYAALEERAKAFEGLDPAEVKEKLEKIRKGEYSSADQLEDMRRSLTQQAEKRETELQQRIQILEQSAMAQHLDSEFSAACASTGGNRNLLAGLKGRIRTELEEDDNGNVRPVSRVLSEKGEVMISQRADRRGEPMSVEEFLDSMRSHPDYKLAFPVAQGGGGSGRTLGGKNRFEGLSGGSLLAAARQAQQG